MNSVLVLGVLGSGSGSGSGGGALLGLIHFGHIPLQLTESMIVLCAVLIREVFGHLSRESVRYSRVIGVLCRSYMFRSLYWRQEAARVILLACSPPTVDGGSSL